MTSARAQTTAGRAFDSPAVPAVPRPEVVPRFPDLRGIERFAGHVIHTARWDQDYDMAHERVAVIGTGASAIARIPELVKRARSVEVFQRTPAWVLPRFGYRLPEWAAAWHRAPLHPGLETAIRAHLRLAVRDPWLRRQLTPSFRAGCSRLHFSDDYYPALQSERCKLITWPIATLVPKGVRTADGIERWFDCIVFATGVDRAAAAF